MEAEMAAHAKRIEIAPEDRRVLEKWANARATERRLVDRARIVLLAGEGRPASEIAGRIGCSLPTVKTWRARYQRDGLDGLRDRRSPAGR
jgi:DNA-directed RNA polymerase specialized sigma24 family protein